MTKKEPMVYVVDDDPGIRKAVVRLFESIGLRTQAFASATHFLDRESFDGPCCLVLDVRMPGMSGMELQQVLLDAGENLPIVFLTGYGDVPMAVEALKKGAVDFLTKPINDQKLFDAVQIALREHERSRQLAARNARIQSRLDLLSERERQILDLVVRGLMNKQIGKELDISEATVKSHRGRVMEKMRAASLPDLVRTMERICPSQ